MKKLLLQILVQILIYVIFFGFGYYWAKKSFDTKYENYMADQYDYISLYKKYYGNITDEYNVRFIEVKLRGSSDGIYYSPIDSFRGSHLPIYLSKLYIDDIVK